MAPGFSAIGRGEHGWANRCRRNPLPGPLMYIYAGPAENHARNRFAYQAAGAVDRSRVSDRSPASLPQTHQSAASRLARRTRSSLADQTPDMQNPPKRRVAYRLGNRKLNPGRSSFRQTSRPLQALSCHRGGASAARAASGTGLLTREEAHCPSASRQTAPQISAHSPSDSSSTNISASPRLGQGKDGDGPCRPPQEAEGQTHCKAVFLSIGSSNPGENFPPVTPIS
jgi:hypothetical protein